MGLQPFDIFVLVTCGIMTFWGGIRGMCSQQDSLISLVAGWYCSSHYYSVVADQLPESYGPWREVGAMILVFVLVNVVIHLAGGILNKMINSVIKGFNRQLGAILGLVKGLLICMLVAFFAVMGSDTTKACVENSASGRFLLESIAFIQKYIPEDKTRDKVQNAIEEFRAKTGKNVPAKGDKSKGYDNNQGNKDDSRDIWSILKSKTQNNNSVKNSQATNSQTTSPWPEGTSEFGEKVVSWFKSAAGAADLGSSASQSGASGKSSGMETILNDRSRSLAESSSLNNDPADSQSVTSSLRDLVNSTKKEIISQTATTLAAQLNDVVTDRMTARKTAAPTSSSDSPASASASTTVSQTAAAVQIDTTDSVGYGTVLDRQHFSPESVAPPF